jgi:cell filamentation protein
MADPVIERREGGLTANRVRELAERPLQGRFNADHLKAVHAYIFQDLPHHRPDEMRADVPGWSKFRALEGLTSVHEVHYAHDDVAGRVARVLPDLGGPSALSGLAPDAFACRIARLYGDLDHIHSFHAMLNCKWLRALTPAGGCDPFCRVR